MNVSLLTVNSQMMIGLSQKCGTMGLLWLADFRNLGVDPQVIKWP